MIPSAQPDDASLLANVERLFASVPTGTPLLEDDAVFAGPLFRSLLGDLEQTADDGLEELAASASRVGLRVRHTRLEGLLGRGGMGEVYLGFDEMLHRPVAVKALRMGRSLDEASRGRLLREARALARMDHPGICRVFDLVEEGSERYLVLELIDGKPLGASAPGLDDGEKLRIVAEIAEALAVAHKAGIIHRDLKPDNVMLQADGRARVMDFGIARWHDDPGDVRGESDGLHVGELQDMQRASRVAGLPHDVPWWQGEGSDSLLTRAGSVLGTIRYMSPEQASGARVTTASDIYSLGLILQELMSGESLYPETSSPLELLRLVAAGQVRSPATVKDQRIRGVIERCTARDATDRPTASEVAAALREILALPRRRRRMIGLAVAGLCLVVAVVGVVGERVVENRRSALARRWSDDLRWMEEELRHAYTAPLHDIRGERDLVRARFARLQDDVEQSGWLGRPPGLAAVGRGHLILGEFEDAAECLRQAWEHGNRSPQVALARGSALGWLFGRRYMDADQSTTADERNARREAARQELRDPATRFLSLGSAVEVESSEYVEALLAMVEGRWDEALTAAQAAHRKVPWLYQAKILEGRILGLKGEEAGAAGDLDAAERAFDAAELAFDTAREVGRSDPSVLSYQCNLRLYSLRFVPGWGREVDAMAERALEVCRQAVAIDPDDARNHGRVGDVLVNQAFRRLGSGVDADAILDEARAELDRAIALTPEAHFFERRGVVLTMIGTSRDNQGLPAMAEIDAALAAFARARDLAPARASVYINATWPSMIKAGLLRDAGEDPEPATREAEEDLAQVMELGTNPEGVVSVAANVASVWRIVGEARYLGGGDTAGPLARANELFTIALDSRRRTLPTLVNAADCQLLAALAAYRSGASVEPHLEAVEKLSAEAIEMGPSEYPHLALAGADVLRVRVAIRDGSDAGEALQRARRHANEALSVGEASAMARVQAAQVELYAALARRSGGQAGAVELQHGLLQIDRALEIDANLGYAHAVRGLLLDAQGRQGRAADAFAEALRLNPELEYWIRESREEVAGVLASAKH